MSIIILLIVLIYEKQYLHTKKNRLINKNAGCIFPPYLPVGQAAHDDPGDGEDDDEGGAGQDLVLPALATVGPDTARGGGDTLSLTDQTGALALGLARRHSGAVASLVAELEALGQVLAGDGGEEVGHLPHHVAQGQQAQSAHPGHGAPAPFTDTHPQSFSKLFSILFSVF